MCHRRCRNASHISHSRLYGTLNTAELGGNRTRRRTHHHVRRHTRRRTLQRPVPLERATKAGETKTELRTVLGVMATRVRTLRRTRGISQQTRRTILAHYQAHLARHVHQARPLAPRLLAPLGPLRIRASLSTQVGPGRQEQVGGSTDGRGYTEERPRSTW